MLGYKYLNFYVQSNGFITGKIDPGFIAWLQYAVDRLLAHNTPERKISRRIIDEKNISNLSRDERSVFISKVLDIHVIQTNCINCGQPFSWVEHSIAIPTGDGRIHRVCP